MPHLVVLDSGKTFKGSSLKAFLNLHGISWQFNVPRVPWRGGIFERMMRSVKRRLKKTLGNTGVSYETVLIEAEGILNSGLLTYLHEDLEEPLAPASLCIGCTLWSFVSGITLE